MTVKPLEQFNRHLHSDEEYSNMYLDSRSRLWLAMKSGGLMMIDIKTGKTGYYDRKQLNDSPACDITEDSRQRLTVATYADILQLNENTLAFESEVSFQRNSAHRLYHGRQGQLLLGMLGSGLMRVDLERHELKPLEVLASNPAGQGITKVLAYLADRNGNQWIGCSQKGLLFVPGNEDTFHFLPLSSMASDNGNMLRNIFIDRQNRRYVCQERGGITNVDLDGRTLAHWMGETTVMTLADDGGDGFWVGTFRNGLYHLDPKSGRAEWMPQTGTQRIGSITRDKQGNIYTAVFNDGLHSYTPDGKTERTLCGGHLELNNIYLNKLFTAIDGKIWIGHYYGIDVYDPTTDRLVDVGIPDALRPAVVYAIVQSPRDHSIWIGTSKGLFRYIEKGVAEASSSHWLRYTDKNGLPNNIVCGLATVADGSVWASTYRGLGLIAADGQTTRYYRGSGLQNWSYLRGAYAQTTDGEIAMGNQDGITYFRPGNISKNQFEQGITLTAMLLGDGTVNATTLSNGSRIISKPIDDSDVITVSYLESTFSLRFSSMDFRDPQNVHYEFRFEGEGDKNQWYQTESGRSEIFFSHLSVGSHHLKVRAYDNGVYSQEKTIVIRVSPPWYRTWVAYIVYLLAMIGVGALWWRYYWNKRQAETNEEKIKFFVDISHELRSPLTLIKSPLDNLLTQPHDAKTMRALKNMQRNTDRLLGLLNEILSIRKIEKGQLRLHFAETDVAQFIGNLCHNYEYMAEQRSISLSFRAQESPLQAWVDRDSLEKIVSNLINNAFKYMDDGGAITVELLSEKEKNSLRIVVLDTGPGIDEAHLKRLFDRFYQASARPGTGQMGYGIGLNLTKQLVGLHGGVITARNRVDGHGAEFAVTLPLGNSHLPKSQLVTAESGNDKKPEPSRPAVADSDKPRKARRKTNYRIAVVDDDEEIRNFLQTELGESYYVYTYADGLSGLEGITDHVPDLVVSDVNMPQMDGFELLRRVKGSTTTSHIPVILLTTKAEHVSRIEGLSQGADAYVDKPFNLEELETLISSLIANRRRIKGKFSGMQGQEANVRKIELKGNDAVLMEKIMDAINSKIDDSDFNVEALSSAVGLSRVQLHRRMKDLTGMSVGEFIRNLRLQQAARLLEEGDITVSQVTYAVGFGNPNNFSAAFKKHFGVTPTEYIAKHKSKE